MEIWELEARESARDLAARYAQYADTGRFDEMVELFAPDCSFEAAGDPKVHGREGLRAYLHGARDRLATETTSRLIRHHVTTHRIDVTGPDTATGAVYYLAITERGPDHWGRYRDEYARDPETGRWWFTYRLMRLDGAAPGSWAATTETGATGG